MRPLVLLLLFGRTVRGQLELVRKQWQDKKSLPVPVSEFLSELYTNLLAMTEKASKSDLEAKKKYKQWYDQGTRKKSFQPGEYVLMFNPVGSSKLEAAYNGPYLIEEKISPVTYRISTPGRRKTMRIVHSNFLKKWSTPSAEVVTTSVIQDKCLIGSSYCDLLGHTVGGGKIQPLQAKIDAIIQYKWPTTKRDIRAWLGISGYYRKFIPSYAERIAELTAALRKEKPDSVCWNQSMEKEFNNLKDALAGDLVLHCPDYDLPLSWKQMHLEEEWVLCSPSILVMVIIILHIFQRN